MVTYEIGQMFCFERRAARASVFGPLLFVIFINDIDQRLYCRSLEFADDTKLLGLSAVLKKLIKLGKI